MSNFNKLDTFLATLDAKKFNALESCPRCGKYDMTPSFQFGHRMISEWNGQKHFCPDIIEENRRKNEEQAKLWNEREKERCQFPDSMTKQAAWHGGATGDVEFY